MNNDISLPNGSSQVSSEDFMSVFDVPQDSPQELGSAPNADLNQVPGLEQIAIDERYKDFPHAEAVARTLQSKYDKLYNTNENVVRELTEKEKYVAFLNDLMNPEDDELLEAFLAERKPELLKPKDTSTYIKEKMTAKYGDYKPTREEADQEYGGKAWLYFKDLDKFYEEATQKSGTRATTIKELKAKRDAEALAEQTKTNEVIANVKKTMNWDDEQLKRYYAWTQKLSAVDLAKMYSFALRTMRIPDLTNVGGNNAPKSDRNNFLNTF